MSIGRMYSYPLTPTAMTAAGDIFELSIPSTMVGILRRVKITQSTEFGDAQSEQLRFQIKKGIGATSGTGGSAANPQKHQTGSAAGTAGEQFNTGAAVAGGGSLTVIQDFSENVFPLVDERPVPDEPLVFAPSEMIVIALVSTPADSITIGGFIVVEMIG